MGEKTPDSAKTFRRFRNHVATDGSLLGVSGKWSACGWSAVQRDHDEEMGPMHGVDGTFLRKRYRPYDGAR